MYMHETETAKFLQQAQNAGLQGKIRFIGASSALAPSTLELAADAANGVQGFVPYSATAAGMQELAKTYADTHNGGAPDHNYYKAYVALWTIAYGTQEIGKVDQKGLIGYLHNRVLCVDKHPHLLSSTYWDDTGNIDRQTYVVKVADQRQSVVDTIPPLGASHFSECGNKS
jgi:branched-chain amino acid transport system substrate-binding protein